jgi:RimJ/RimL family protein N-acetyltransferase
MDDPLPVLTERTRLRRLAVADLADFQRYRNDPDVGRWQGWKGMDDGAATGFLQEMADSDFCPPGRWFQLGIARRDSDQLIGDIGVHMHGGAGLLAELGFTLTPAAQGRGLATEAVGAMRCRCCCSTRRCNASCRWPTPATRQPRWHCCSAWACGVLRCCRPFLAASPAWRRTLPGTATAACRCNCAWRALADAAAVAELLIVSRRVLMPFVTWAHSDDELRGWVAEQLVPSGGVTLALAHGRVVGVLALSTQADAHWIDQLYVHPAQAACGVGATLLAHALAWAAAHDAALPVRLYTFQANAHAREFYERHGFVAVALSDGVANEERCPDVLYERLAAPSTMPA